MPMHISKDQRPTEGQRSCRRGLASVPDLLAARREQRRVVADVCARVDGVGEQGRPCCSKAKTAASSTPQCCRSGSREGCPEGRYRFHPWRRCRPSRCSTSVASVPSVPSVPSAASSRRRRGPGGEAARPAASSPIGGAAGGGEAGGGEASAARPAAATTARRGRRSAWDPAYREAGGGEGGRAGRPSAAGAG